VCLILVIYNCIEYYYAEPKVVIWLNLWISKAFVRVEVQNLKFSLYLLAACSINPIYCLATTVTPVVNPSRTYTINPRAFRVRARPFEIVGVACHYTCATRKVFSENTKSKIRVILAIAAAYIAWLVGDITAIGVTRTASIRPFETHVVIAVSGIAVDVLIWADAVARAAL
jgi:hypothetical protein